MTTVEAVKVVPRAPQVWPLSVKAYHALSELGLIPEKTELLYGQVFNKMPKSPLHSFLHQFLADILRPAIPAASYLRIEQPITCADSAPEPGLAVGRGRTQDYRQEHPRTAARVVALCATSHYHARSHP